MSRKKISKDEVLALVNKHYTVEEMAEALDVDYNDLFDFYAECSFENRSDFPIGFLITQTWLEKKIKTTPIATISLETRTSPSVIRRLAKKYGIPTKPMLKDVLTQEVLHALFVEQCLTDAQIAEKYSCSIETIKKLRSKYKITSDERIDRTAELSIEVFHKLYVTYGFTNPQLTQVLGISPYQLLCLRDKFANAGHPLSEEIANRKKSYTYQALIEELLKELDPALILELLSTKTIAEAAEMYGIIPPAEQGVETFSKKWLEIVLHKMDVTEIVKKYHIGAAYINNMMSEYGLKPVAVADRLDDELVRHLFVDKCWSDDQIAFLLGTSEYAIITLRKKKGIRPSQRPPLQERLPLDDFVQLYVEDNLTVAQIASLYGVSEKTIASLKLDYSISAPEIKSHTSSGVSEDRLMALKKQLRFKGMH